MTSTQKAEALFDFEPTAEVELKMQVNACALSRHKQTPCIAISVLALEMSRARCAEANAASNGCRSSRGLVCVS